MQRRRTRNRLAVRDTKTELSFDDDRLDIDELAVACRAVLMDQHGKSAAFADRRHAVMPSPSIVVDPRATTHSEGAKCLEVGPSVAIVDANDHQILWDVERKESLVRVGVALQISYFEREARGRSSDQCEIGTRSGRSVVLHLGGE